MRVLNRRSLLKSMGGICVIAQAQTRWGSEVVRYPDPNVVSLDKAFGKYRIGSAVVERVATGYRWAEGPAWNGAGNYLVWSDIPNNRQMRWLEEDEHVDVFRKPSNYSNGNTFDWQGRQISCEHQARQVVRYDQTGEVTVLADKYTNKRLNAPNDVVVDPDGNIWFTDPGYGATSTYEGGRFPMELKEAVYRVDGKTGQITLVTDELAKPNGLCFSPDFKKLYICDTGFTHYPNARKEIRVYEVNGAKLGNSRTFSTTAWGNYVGIADGIRADRDGNIWAAIGQGDNLGGSDGAKYDGVYCITPEGQRIGWIKLPEICANLCFGGTRRNRLFMCASQSVYSLYTEAQGANIC